MRSIKTLSILPLLGIQNDMSTLKPKYLICTVFTSRISNLDITYIMSTYDTTLFLF